MSNAYRPNLNVIDLSQLNVDQNASDQEKLQCISNFLDQKIAENKQTDPYDPINNPVARDLRRSFKRNR